MNSFWTYARARGNTGIYVRAGTERLAPAYGDSYRQTRIPPVSSRPPNVVVKERSAPCALPAGTEPSAVAVERLFIGLVINTGTTLAAAAATPKTLRSGSDILLGAHPSGRCRPPVDGDRGERSKQSACCEAKPGRAPQSRASTTTLTFAGWPDRIGGDHWKLKVPLGYSTAPAATFSDSSSGRAYMLYTVLESHQGWIGSQLDRPAHMMSQRRRVTSLRRTCILLVYFFRNSERKWFILYECMTACLISDKVADGNGQV